MLSCNATISSHPLKKMHHVNVRNKFFFFKYHYHYHVWIIMLLHISLSPTQFFKTIKKGSRIFSCCHRPSFSLPSRRQQETTAAVVNYAIYKHAHTHKKVSLRTWSNLTRRLNTGHHSLKHQHSIKQIDGTVQNNNKQPVEQIFRCRTPWDT